MAHGNGGRPWLHPRCGDRYRTPAARTVLVLAVVGDEAAGVYVHRGSSREEVALSLAFLRSHCKLVDCCAAKPRAKAAETVEA